MGSFYLSPVETGARSEKYGKSRIKEDEILKAAKKSLLIEKQKKDLEKNEELSL
jgi:hypothetical protein